MNEKNFQINRTVNKITKSITKYNNDETIISMLLRCGVSQSTFRFAEITVLNDIQGVH